MPNWEILSMLKSHIYSIIGAFCLIFCQAKGQLSDETVSSSLPFNGNITVEPVPFIINIGQTDCPRNIAFVKGGQTLGNTRTFDIAIEDIDLDSDNDVLMANYIGLSQLWLNDGNGGFALSPQTFNVSEVHGVGVRDFNGDAYPDIFLISHAGPSKVYFNNTNGTFTASGQNIGSGADSPIKIALGDVDSDGDVDAVISYYMLPIKVWLNDGNGFFTVSSSQFGGANAPYMELADVNGDTYLDLFLAVMDRPDEVWLNDGSGNFVNSGQTLGGAAGYDHSASGDIDGDGDIDIAVSNSVEGVKIWLNQKNTGSFVEAGPYFAAGIGKVALFDADLDGDLDLFTSHNTDGNVLWINTGSANFESLGPVFGNAFMAGIASGKLDEDDDFDVVLGVKENSGGNPVYFNNSTDTCHGSVTDIDGNVYGTITIGTQVWMAENLKVTHYSSGETIPEVTDPTEWANLSTGASCKYGNDVGNVATYGRLYNWHAVADIRNIAPVGWHVATDADWKQLERFLGMNQTQADSMGWRGTAEGGKLKESDTTHWTSPNIAATNETEFSGLPGGYRYEGGVYDGIGLHGVFWTSSEFSSSFAWTRGLGNIYSGIHRFDGRKVDGFSVRCVKNAYCCDGATGNVDCSELDEPDISDITRLIDFLYITHMELCCTEEADADASGGEPDISDITRLIDYLYISHLPLSTCNF